MEKETYQKELLKTRKGNKEDKRQIIRKTMEKSSRLLDMNNEYKNLKAA